MLIVNNNENYIRLDKFLVAKTPFNRTEIIKAIKEGRVIVNGKVCTKQGWMIKLKDEITFNDKTINKVKQDTNRILTRLNVQTEQIPLKVLYEENNFMIVYKPSGVLVYPVYTNDTKTLAHALYAYYHQKHITNFGDSIRQGIVHRLDRKTSGLVLVAKTTEFYEKFIKMMQNHQITRKYTAIVNNRFNERELTHSIKINKPIGNSKTKDYKMSVGTNAKNYKEAITVVKVIKNLGTKHSLVECDLITGRTHQVRVHMRYINHPIVNDELYGCETKFSDYGQYLMCTQIAFINPETNKNILLDCAWDDEFSKKVNELEYA